MFGLPWFAVIAIVAIVGGIYAGIRDQEMKLEAKRLTSSKESQELRKMIFNLKSRIEHLEAIATEAEADRGQISLDEIEIKDDSGHSKSTKVRG